MDYLVALSRIRWDNIAHNRIAPYRYWQLLDLTREQATPREIASCETVILEMLRERKL